MRFLHPAPGLGEALRAGLGDPPDEARMYFVTGAPHGVGVAGAPWLGQGEVNSMQPTPILRACLVLMDRWATEGVPPPAIEV